MYKQLIRSLELSSEQEKILNFEGDFRTRQSYYDCPKNQDDDRLFDILGYFDFNEAQAIFFCDHLISGCAEKYAVSYHSLFSVIALHEYAHLIHFALNPKEFKSGIELFANRTDYVEAWAQYATWKVCEKEGGELRATFEALLEGQATEYQIFNEFTKVSHQHLTELFLNPERWCLFAGEDWFIEFFMKDRGSHIVKDKLQKGEVYVASSFWHHREKYGPDVKVFAEGLSEERKKELETCSVKDTLNNLGIF